MPRKIVGIVLLLSSLGVLTAVGPAIAKEDRRPKTREVTVSCSSTVAYDPGGCERAARKKCKGEPRFMKVLSSTPLASSGLNAISARYRCEPWTQ